VQADYCAIASDGKDLQRVYGHAMTAAQNDFLGALCYNPLSLVYFKLKQRPADAGFIVQLTREQAPEIGALAWYHLWGQTKAPPGKGALIFLGTNDWQFRMQDRPVAERIADARRQALRYYPDLAALEESAEVTPWPRATLVGRVGHYRRLREFVADMDTKSRIQYGGDYLSQSCVGAAVATGNQLAARIAAAARSRA
jgi:protoporphyrinogen oxidase